MKSRSMIITGAVNMFIAVAAGAFGAHGLKAILSSDMLAVWQTAAHYQALHALGLLALSQMTPRLDEKILGWAGAALLAGIVLFSGSLYLLALTGVPVLGVITPFGGLGFLVGWAMLAWAAYRSAAN